MFQCVPIEYKVSSIYIVHLIHISISNIYIFRSYILSFYYIVFGCLTIAAELKFKFIRKKLMLISMNTGRGFWYFFLGTLSLGGEWWSIVAAVILMILGILNVCAGFLNKSEQNAEDQRLSDQDEYQQHRPSFQQIVQITKAVSQNVDALHKAYDPPHQMVQNQQKQNAYDDY